MAYQLYLYKEFSTKSGNDIRLEIFERDYSGSQIEIDDLASSPVSLITDNASNDLTNNIIKSSVIINLVDTEQVDYTRLFTSDATKFKVVVKINGVTEWTGYLTPDSFYQPLTYRNIIQLTARDNLGMLSEFVYQEDGLASISSVISAVLDKISFGCTLEYRVKKVDGNGTSIVNGLVNRTLFFGKNYEEVLSIILGGIGCQMRFVGGNKYAVFDVADLDSYGEAGDAQDFFFINQSGNLELVPAWKDLQVRQDYATTQEVLTQRPKQSDLVFAANKTILTDYDYNTPPVAPSISIPTYTPFGNNWVGTLPILSPYEWGYDKNTILLTKMSSADFENTLSYPSHIEFFKDVPAYNNGIKITFNVHNLLMMPDYELFTAGKQVLTDRSPILGSKTKGYGIIILYNIFLVSGGVTYRLGETWEVAGSSPRVNTFYIDEAYKDQNKQQNGIDIPCEINILSLQAGGQLQFHLYGYYIYGTLTDDVYFDFIAKISEFKFQLLSEEPGGRESLVVNNDNFNIKGGIDLYVGQVPTGKLNSLSMLGGIYQNTPPYYPPMGGFKRTGGAEMHLSEQIGREYLNLRKQQRISLSGTIMAAGLPNFGKSFEYKGKNYSLNYGSLDYESEKMQVELIEAESYTYEDYTFIDAEVDTGTGSLGSGATEFIQWSAAGNAKRIYELDTASEADQGGAFVFIDKSGLTAAKKVPISSLLVDAYTKTESDSRFASIDGDLTQDFSAKKLTTATLLLPQSAPTLASGEAAIYSLDSGFSGETPSGAGSMTNITLSLPTGLEVSLDNTNFAQSKQITGEGGTFYTRIATNYFLPTTAQFASKLDVSLKGSANGLAELDENGFVKNTQLPSYVDDVLEYDNLAAFPTTGETGKIYIAKDTNKTYRWGGSSYVVISETIALGETSSTAYRGDRGKIAYDHSQSTGNPHGTTAADVGALALSGGILSNSLRIVGGHAINADDYSLELYALEGSEVQELSLRFHQSQRFYHQIRNNGTGFRFTRGNSGDFVNISAAKVSSTTLILPQTTPNLSSGEMAIYGLESGFSGETPSGAGSVTSISMVVPTGLSVTPETITESGTFTISYASGYRMFTEAEINGKQAKLIGTGASSLVRVNTLGVIAYDDSTYLTGNQTITLSGIITGSGTTAITTAIADGALSIAKTDGLQSALDAKMATLSYPDLVAIEALTGTSGVLKKTAANTWALDTTAYYHSGNSNSSSVAWAASTFTEGGTLLSNKYLGISANAVSSSTLKTLGLYVWTAAMLPNEFPDGIQNSFVQEANGFPSYGSVMIIKSYSGGGGTLQLYVPYGVNYGGPSLKIRHSEYGINTGNSWGDWKSLWDSGNSNLTTIDWSAKNLALAGSITGATTISASGIASLTNTTQSTAYTNGALVLSGGLGIAKDLFSNGKAVFASSVQMLENINTNLRIPKVAPTSPTSGQYYFYIVE